MQDIMPDAADEQQTVNPYELTSGLRKLADLLDASETFRDKFDHSYRHLVYVSTREELLTIVRDVGGRWDKDEDPGDYFGMTRDLGDGVTIYVYTARHLVCERVVTGTRTVHRPAPDAPMVEVEEEIVEWRCPGSLLAGFHAKADTPEWGVRREHGS